MKQRPIRLPRGQKTAVRSQFAALPWRLNDKGKVEVCLVTSRRTKRWILPKGWPMRGTTPQKAARTEAWEEAGLKGKVNPLPLGLYSYRKMLNKQLVPVVAVIYTMEVSESHDTWPEAHQRRRKWMSPKKASEKVKDPELRTILRQFQPVAT